MTDARDDRFQEAKLVLDDVVARFGRLSYEQLERLSVTSDGSSWRHERGPSGRAYVVQIQIFRPTWLERRRGARGLDVIVAIDDGAPPLINRPLSAAFHVPC